MNPRQYRSNSERARCLGVFPRGSASRESKPDKKRPSAFEIFQAAVAIFVSLATAFIGWKAFQLNEVAAVNSEQLKQIELRLSERKIDFEQAKDVYDRVEKYLLSEQDERRGQAIAFLVGAMPESGFRANLLSILTVQAAQESVSIAAAEAYVGNSLPTKVGPKQFDGSAKLQPAPGGGAMYTLLDSFSFVDSNGRKWSVPKGFVFTGSSVPRVAWNVVSPNGAAVGAFVLHDYHSTQRTEASSDVNQMFYEALIASGVSAAEARVLYVATQTLGPKYSARQR